MNFHSACAPKAQRFPAQKPPRQTFSPRPHQTEAAACLNNAIWDAEGRPLFVAPVSAGKTLILVMVAKTALERGCKRVIVVSRSKHVAGQSLETLRRYAPGILGGLYTGSKKQTACQILFATAPTLARHLNIVEAADLILVDEADQAYLRNETKEYSAILRAARRYAGVTGTPFILQKGRTVPIFSPGKTFDKPCGLITKNELRDLGHFHFIEPAPVTPTRRLKIDRKTKVDLSGDYDTRVQSTSDAMLSAIAADTKAAMDQLPSRQQFLFFGASTDQCDAQAVAYKSAGLTVEPYHNKLSAAEQEKAMAHFRAGELAGLCTVTKVNHGFNLLRNQGARA